MRIAMTNYQLQQSTADSLLQLVIGFYNFIESLLNLYFTSLDQLTAYLTTFGVIIQDQLLVLTPAITKVYVGSLITKQFIAFFYLCTLLLQGSISSLTTYINSIL